MDYDEASVVVHCRYVCTIVHIGRLQIQTALSVREHAKKRTNERERTLAQ